MVHNFYTLQATHRLLRYSGLVWYDECSCDPRAVVVLNVRYKFILLHCCCCRIVNSSKESVPATTIDRARFLHYTDWVDSGDLCIILLVVRGVTGATDPLPGGLRSIFDTVQVSHYVA